MANLDGTPTVNADLEMAVATLKAKCAVYDNFWRYYEGKQPIVYSLERLREIFKSIDARFTQNWCSVVVDSVHDRIQLQRITIADNEVMSARLDAIMSASQLLLESDDAHLAALVTGESYIIAWPDEETGKPEVYYNDPRNVHLFYDAASPKKKLYAVKWWIGDDGYRYATLYYPDRLEYYKSSKAVRKYYNGSYTYNEVSGGKSFDSIGSAPNEYGVVPVFHLRRDRRVIKGELQNIIEPQDAVNKLLADMMIAAEFGAFPQRYIISQADPGKFKNAPNQIWDVPASDGEGQATSVGQFDPTQLSNYLEAIDKWTIAIAIISRTPKHYFFGQGGDPSGEALIAMEAPLNKKAEKYIQRFTATWSEIAGFLLLLDGAGVVDDNSIVPHFDKPETVQPYTQALIRKESVAAGVPLLWQMEQEGYTEEEMADLQAAQDDQQQKQADTMAKALTNQQRAFDQGGNRPMPMNGSKPPRGTPNSA